MQLPNWVKVVWWLVLVGALSYFLRERLPDLIAGKAAAADVAVFGVWMALLLAPLFTEVTLLGITLKNEIEELKGQLSAQIADVRSDIRNAIDVRTTFSPTFNVPAPPTDAQLPQLEAQIKAAVTAALKEHGRAAPPKDLNVPDDVTFLFRTRFHLESELRRLSSRVKGSSPQKRSMPVHVLSRSLVETGLLDPGLASAIREVYSVCSPAVHGEPVTEAQVSFVRDVAPNLIAALQAILGGDEVTF